MATWPATVDSFRLGTYDTTCSSSAVAWDQAAGTARLWERDASLWTSADEAQWLGWLDIVEHLRGHRGPFDELARDVREGGFRHLVVLGMGGSSLCPDVLRRTFGVRAGFPELIVVDSVVPAQVAAVAKALDPARTLFIVASKSGGTIEPNLLYQFFRARVAAAVGAERAGEHFVAITDPGTAMERVATEHQFRRILHGWKTIGGRFSALSPFGMGPAAAMGLDVGLLLDRAAAMVARCGAKVPACENPGVRLGVTLGELARRGRDKVTLVVSPSIAGLGGWIEQLLAESTGKHGQGLVPIDGEPLTSPSGYGTDRVFCQLRLASDDHAEADRALYELAAAGHPVISLSLDSVADVVAEFFRWEFATAVAGAVLGVNPFDQPDVEAAKIAARALMDSYRTSGALATVVPVASSEGLALFCEGAYGRILARQVGAGSVCDWLAAHVNNLVPDDYFAINAFLPSVPSVAAPLEELRRLVRDRRRVATTLGFGPRFLHSTGQLHKGGPRTGVFLEITSDDTEDLAVPGEPFTLGAVKQAQALGDFSVLGQRGRRAVRVHVGADLGVHLARLVTLVGDALSVEEHVTA